MVVLILAMFRRSTLCKVYFIDSPFVLLVVFTTSSPRSYAREDECFPSDRRKDEFILIYKQGLLLMVILDD